MQVIEYTINDKKVFVTEKHHHNLLPWSEIRQRQLPGLTIFMLDHHNDLIEPFRSFAFNPDKMVIDYSKVDEELNKLDYHDLASIKFGIAKLKNDEHIQTAIKLDIIEKILIISYQNSSNEVPTSFEQKEYHKNLPSPPYIDQEFPTLPVRPYHYPDSSIYKPENICSVGCTKRPHDDIV